MAMEASSRALSRAGRVIVLRTGEVRREAVGFQYCGAVGEV